MTLYTQKESRGLKRKMTEKHVLTDDEQKTETEQNMHRKVKQVKADNCGMVSNLQKLCGRNTPLSRDALYKHMEKLVNCYISPILTTVQIVTNESKRHKSSHKSITCEVCEFEGHESFNFVDDASEGLICTECGTVVSGFAVYEASYTHKQACSFIEEKENTIQIKDRKVNTKIKELCTSHSPAEFTALETICKNLFVYLCGIGGRDLIHCSDTFALCVVILVNLGVFDEFKLP